MCFRRNVSKSICTAWFSQTRRPRHPNPLEKPHRAIFLWSLLLQASSDSNSFHFQSSHELEKATRLTDKVMLKTFKNFKFGCDIQPFILNTSLVLNWQGGLLDSYLLQN